MPHEKSERASRYRERARALHALAEQTESRPARAALKGVALDYELMALKLETNGRAILAEASSLVRQP